MKNLIAVLKKVDALADEVAKLNQIEAKARQEVKAAVESGNADSDEHIHKLSNATTRLALVPAHRERLNQLCAAAVEELKPALRDASNKWGKYVCAQVDAKYDEFITQAAPFYGSKRQARRELSDEGIPLLAELRRAHWSSHHPAPSFDEQRSLAEQFMAHVARWSKKFDWEMPE